MAKWIDFQQAPSMGKTEIWNVISKEGAHHLGTIKWYGPWRQYSFFPNGGTVFERTCLTDIVAKINELMLKRKAQAMVL